MSSVNKVVILGRLTKDPELRFMPNGEGVANFSLATSEKWKDKSGEKQEKSEFHNCVAYRKLAEIIGQYLKKGSQVYIEGKLQTKKWEKDGVTRYSTEIIVDEMVMLGEKPVGAGGSGGGGGYTPTSKGGESGSRDKFKEAAASDFLDDVPF